MKGRIDVFTAVRNYVIGKYNGKYDVFKIGNKIIIFDNDSKEEIRFYENELVEDIFSVVDKKITNYEVMQTIDPDDWSE